MQNRSAPSWRRVTFPTGWAKTYKTLERANTGRIIARAWFNWREEHKHLPLHATGWAGFARALGIDKKPPYNKGDMDGAGTPLYYLCNRGVLPVDTAATEKIFKLAGYPWE